MFLKNVLSAEQLGADSAEVWQAAHVFADMSGKLFFLGELPTALVAGQHHGPPVALQVIGQVLLQCKLLPTVAARVQYGAMATSEVFLQFIFAAKTNIADRTHLASWLFR